MTRIHIIDPAVLQPAYTSRAKPSELFREFDALRQCEPLAGLYEHLLPRSESRGKWVMAAAEQDGHDVLAAQQGWGLFNPTRDRDLSSWVFDRFAECDIVGRLRDALEPWAAALPGESLTVVVLPADPANRSLMAMNHGLSGFAGVPGWLALQLWPSDGNLDRLDSAVGRLAAHQVRAADTVADYLAREGLAAALAGDWAVAVREPVGWEAELARVARHYGKESYDDVVVNVYGNAEPAGPDRPPPAVDLNTETLEYAAEVISGLLSESDPRVIAGVLYGDALVGRQGHPAVGLPDYAGLYVADTWVRRSLANAEVSPAEALRWPASVWLI